MVLPAKIRILGSGREVGRGAIAVEYNNKAVLLDYGVNFDENDNPVMPLHIKPSMLEAVVLTHTHLDHIGGAPILYTSIAPQALATKLTQEAAGLLLEDFLKLSGYYLDFEISEVNRLLSSIRKVRPGSVIELENFTLEFYSAGHIPGSLSVRVILPHAKILYTSDVNTIDSKLVNGASFNGVKANILIIESTYGDSDHPPREKVERRFVQTVREVLDKGGTVLVPVFSVGRGQEILCVLIENDIYPVSVDGMVREATDIMLRNKEFLRKPELLEKAREEYTFLRGWQDRRKAWRRSGVIVASAGMLKGGPSRYYLRKIGGSERNALLLVSFQAPNTPGRSILETGKFNSYPEPIKARVEWFDFSSHAGASGLLKIAKELRELEKVILVHGELKAQEALARRIQEELGIDVLIPENGDVLEHH